MLDALLRRLACWFALAGGAVALASALMVVVSIGGRALLGWPIPGDFELTQVGIALAISLSIPWCQLRGGHIIVDFFTERSRERTRRRLDGAGAALLALMCALLAWRTGVGALASQEAGETTMILALPMWGAYASLAPGLALSALIAARQAALHFAMRPLDGLSGSAQADDTR